MRRLAAIILAALLVVSRLPQARADDSAFEQWVGAGDDEGPVVIGSSTPELRAADDLMREGRWLDAARVLLSVKYIAAPLVRERVDQRLAVALYRAGYETASLRLFRGIANKPHHAERRAALGWLTRLAGSLPDAADVGDALARYSDAQLARAAPPGSLPRVRFLAGRAHYHNGELDLARVLLAGIPEADAPYVRAQLLLAIIEYLQGDPRRAVRALQRAVIAVDHHPERYADAAILRDTAYMNMARIHYGEATPEDEPFAVRPKHLVTALRYWDAIARDSPLWVQALHEQSWAFFLGGNSERSLGLQHTVGSPYFEEAHLPEGDLVRAINLLMLCHYDDAMIIAARFVRRYQPAEKELQALLAKGIRWAHLTDKVRLGNAIAARVLAGVRTEARIAGYVRYDARLARDRRRAAAFDTTAHAYAAGLIAVSRRDNRGNALAFAKMRLREELQELRRLLREMQKVVIDVVASQRRLLAQSIGPGVWRVDVGYRDEIDTDPEHVLWPFDGEYWIDELGTYRALVRSRCSGG